MIRITYRKMIGMNYNTQMLDAKCDSDISYCAELLRNGSIAAIPTETVYGLAADALDEGAVEEIFAAKGRPQDNPLIVHIADYEDIYKYVRAVPEAAKMLAEAFWPGPLTMVLPKKDIIPSVTSGGLDTVGIRLPAHPAAREIIRRCSCPLAAPSANLSGSPSPTSAAHVMSDMNGRIPAVVDGGECTVGVESTVVSFDAQGRVTVLRPGFVSVEEIAAIVGEGNVICAKGVTAQLSDGERVLSPGMKYKHYSPTANVTLIRSGSKAFADYVNSRNEENACAVIFGSEKEIIELPVLIYGDTDDEQARRVFGILREIDEKGFSQAYVRCPSDKGVGLAVYNRLLRSAGFEVIRLEP